MQFAAILFKIQCIPFTFIEVLPINLLYKLDWLPIALLVVLAGENQQLCVGHCRKSLLKSTFFYTGHRSSCRFKREMNAEFNDIAKYFDIIETHVSP